MGCGIDCVKWFLFVFNFLWVLFGITLLAIGIFGIVTVKSTEEPDIAILAVSIGTIIIGGLIFIIAFFGCCGAVKESHCMVVTYAVFLMLILIIQVAFGIWAFVIDIDGRSKPISQKFHTSFDHYWHGKAHRDYVDRKQSELECCGITGPSDYGRFDNRTIPWSCCEPTESVIKFNPCTIDKAYQVGCTDKVIDVYNRAAKSSGGVSFGVAIAEVVGIVFALTLANSIKNDHRRGYRV